MITKGNFYGYIEDENQERELIDAYCIIVAQSVKEWGYLRDLFLQRSAYLVMHPDEAKPGEVTRLHKLINGTL